MDKLIQQHHWIIDFNPCREKQISQFFIIKPVIYGPCFVADSYDGTEGVGWRKIPLQLVTTWITGSHLIKNSRSDAEGFMSLNL